MNYSEKNVFAYFQPILCAATNQIYSFEILGRFLDNEGNVKSLGPFFSDENTSHYEALRVDRIVRKNAMERYAREKRDEYLFINIRLAWLENYIDKPEEMPTIKWAKELGIDTSRLVIEITEEEFNAKDAHINILSYYKSSGCRIALDDYGKSSSNIERLALLKPDIIKINIDYIHKSESSYHYREYLKSLAAFAEAVGIEVLFEGIETQKQLEICMSSKGRFYQGFIIAPPQASMNDAIVNNKVFLTAIDDVINKQYKDLLHKGSLTSYLDSKLGIILSENPTFYLNNEILESYIIEICSGLPQVLRIYLCDKQGEQITCNYEWQSGEINYRDFLGKNWALRGFFHEAIKIFNTGMRSGLSSSYRDFTTKERILTYFYALDDNYYLFIDIKRLKIKSHIKLK